MKNLMTAVGALALSAGMAFAGGANVYTLTFEGLGNVDDIQGFYNGGTSAQGFSGPNYGVEFRPNSYGLIDSDAGGSGNTANEPSGQTTLIFLNADAAVMNVPAGFDFGFATYYALPNPGITATISIYDGLNATGNLLGSVNLLPNGSSSGDPNGLYSNWTLVGVPFAGVARSVSFGGTANFVAYDDVTFGDIVPAPSSLALLGLGGLAAGRRRR
ncbi:MAG: PEP-CTERM sorting domain-containing protein [Phycisphaerales bacterium]